MDLLGGYGSDSDEDNNVQQPQPQPKPAPAPSKPAIAATTTTSSSSIPESSKRKRAQIVITDLPKKPLDATNDDEDDEEEQARKRKSKGGGLFAFLPKPKAASLLNKRKEAGKASVKSSSGNDENEDQDETSASDNVSEPTYNYAASSGSSDFFTLAVTPEPSINTATTSDQSSHKGLVKVFSTVDTDPSDTLGAVQGPSFGPTETYQDYNATDPSEYYSNASIGGSSSGYDYSYDQSHQYADPQDAGLDDNVLAKLGHRGGKKAMGGIQLVEVKQADQMGGEAWKLESARNLTKHGGVGGSKEGFDHLRPSKLAAKKHNIMSLAFNAKVKENDMADAYANRRASKKETNMRYGF
ncbi:hypothetical protein HDU76_005587 [Blyttiomyces sp. JEL0837]|nr:hypothetical protein HDU76_005587 [Blyttiomyces sp. JEL0837]